MGNTGFFLFHTGTTYRQYRKSAPRKSPLTRNLMFLITSSHHTHTLNLKVWEQTKCHLLTLMVSMILLWFCTVFQSWAFSPQMALTVGLDGLFPWMWCPEVPIAPIMPEWMQCLHVPQLSEGVILWCCFYSLILTKIKVLPAVIFDSIMWSFFKDLMLNYVYMRWGKGVYMGMQVPQGGIRSP